MKSITIHGNTMIVSSGQYTINESMPDFLKTLFGSNKKQGFLGTVLSLIPGFGEKMEGKEKVDDYTAAQQEWFKKWQERRKKELEKDQEHLMNMKVTNYNIAQQKKLNKHDAERKVKEFKQKQELDARKAVLAQLKREGAKIQSWTGLGPSTPEFMAQVISVSERIYEDATPAEQKIKDNVLGIIADISRDEQGNYITDSERVAERLDELYGEKDSDGKVIKGSGIKSPMFDSPEFRSAYDTFVSSRPKDEKEFNERMVQVLTKSPDFKTNEELDNEKQVVEERLTQMKEDEERIKALKDEREQIEKNLKAIEEKKKASEEAVKIKDELEKAGSAEIKDELKQEIQKATNGTDKNDLFPRVTPEDGATPHREVNTKHPLYKKLTSMGLKPEDIKAMVDGELSDKSIEEIVGKISDEQIKTYKDNVLEQQESKIKAYEDAKAAEEENKQRLEKIEDERTKAEETKKEHDSSDMAKRANELARQYSDKPNDGTPITKEDMMKVSATVEHRKEENDHALKEIDEISTKAKKYREELAGDTAYDKAYDKLSDEQKHEIDSITAKPADVIKKDGDKEYMEVDGEEDDPNNPGEKRKKRLYKPAKDDPDYEDKLQAWDTAVSAKFATMPIGEKPVAQQNPPDFNDVKKMREWEANKKAKEAAKQDFIEKNKDKYKNAEDALDVLSDKEWLQDPENVETDDEEDTENSNGEDVVDKETPEEEARAKRIKELEDKKNNGEELSKEEQEELDKKKKEIEDEDNAKDDTAKRNPAKIWKKKKNKTTGKSTKRYYYCGKNAKRREANDSLSPKEYQERLKKYKEAKAAEGKETNTGGSNESITNPQRPIRFKKSPWTMTKLCETKK